MRHLARLRRVAGFDGVVEALSASAGAQVSEGTILVEIGKDDA